MDVFSLVDPWRAKADELGFGRGELQRVLQPGRTRAPVDLAATIRHTVSADGLATNQSTFDRRDFIRA